MTFDKVVIFKFLLGDSNILEHTYIMPFSTLKVKNARNITRKGKNLFRF